MAILLLIERVYPITKPELPTVALDLPDNASPLEQATSVAVATHRGKSSPTIRNLKPRIRRLENVEGLGSLTIIIHNSMAHLDHPDQDPNHPFSVMLNGINYVYVEADQDHQCLL